MLYTHKNGLISVNRATENEIILCDQYGNSVSENYIQIDKEEMAKNYSQAWVSEEDTTYLHKTLEIAKSN